MWAVRSQMPDGSLRIHKNTWERDRIMTKEDMIYEQIKQDILNNEFPAGTVLVERKLTERYQVSRSPVRYALRLLVKDGLLTGEPGKGIMVPVYTLEDILEVYDLLEVLQIYAIQMSLKNYDEAIDKEMSRILEETRKNTSEDRLDVRMQWDIRFHDCIIHNVHNRRLNSIFETLVNQKRRFDITSFHDVEHGKKTNDQHEQIFAALKARDMEGAIAAVRAHEAYIKQYYIEKLITGRYNI